MNRLGSRPCALSVHPTPPESLLDTPGFIPGQSKDDRAAGYGTGLEQFECKSLETAREPRIRIRPWHVYLPNSMPGAGHARDASMQVDLEVTAVQMAPQSLGGMIPARSGMGAFRATPDYAVGV